VAGPWHPNQKAGGDGCDRLTILAVFTKTPPNTKWENNMNQLANRGWGMFL